LSRKLRLTGYRSRGRALNRTDAALIQVPYSAVAGGSSAAKGGRVQLRNLDGVILDLSSRSD
jgi:hypothetical protein